MNKDQVSKIMSALESAGLKNYMVVDDITTKIYNSDTSIIKVDDADEMFVNIRANNVGGSHKRFDSNLEVICMDFVDAHEFIVGADHQKITNFVKGLGLNLSDDEEKLIVKLDNGNYNLIPPTGDYNRFVPLTEEQYERLSPEEKEKYDAEKAAHDEFEKNYTGQNMAARITVG